MTDPETETADARAPELWRVVMGMIYDGLLIISLLVVGAAIVVVPLGLISGKTIPDGHPLFQLWLASWVAAFYLWFWTHGGQTLGMRAWRMRVLRLDGEPLTLWNASVRLLASLLSWLGLGLGFIWIVFGPEHRTWHDRIAGTRLVMLKKIPRKKKSR